MGRRFSGIASTPELDRQGDSLDPAGATFAASIPLLFHHDAKQPIGRVTLTRTPQGIAFDAERGEDGASAVWTGHRQPFRAFDSRAKPLAHLVGVTARARQDTPT